MQAPEEAGEEDRGDERDHRNAPVLPLRSTCRVMVMCSGPRVIGASGAVMAVTGAYLVLFPRSHITLMYVLVLVNGAVEVPCMYLVSFFVALDLALSVAHAK